MCVGLGEPTVSGKVRCLGGGSQYQQHSGPLLPSGPPCPHTTMTHIPHTNIQQRTQSPAGSRPAAEGVDLVVSIYLGLRVTCRSDVSVVRVG